MIAMEQKLNSEKHTKNKCRIGTVIIKIEYDKCEYVLMGNIGTRFHCIWKELNVKWCFLISSTD
jgi:hypothetical protein